MDKKSSDKKLVSFRLPEELLETLREVADRENTTVTELVCRLLRQGLRQLNQSGPQADDRIAALEAEIRELRQLKQVNFSGISPMPVYTSLVPQNVVAAETDVETKQRIVRLEAQMQEGIAKIGEQMASIAKLESMLGEVLAANAACSSPGQSQASVCREDVA